MRNKTAFNIKGKNDSLNELNRIETAIKDQTVILKEILQWIRLSSSNLAKDVLKTSFKNNKEILAYHFSDGENTGASISKLTGLSPSTISRLGSRWKMLGLGEVQVTSGGFKFIRSFDLTMFGIEIPSISQSSKSTAKIRMDENDGNHGGTENAV